MAIYLGNVPTIDLYSGSTPIDRVYLGQSKIYDAFAEISGNLPLSFNARRAENLNDYTIYGTANGSGVKTNNIFSAKLEQGTLDPTGAVMDSDFRVRTSDFITLTNSPYFVLSSVGIHAQAMIYVYDNNGIYLRTLTGEWAAIPLTFSVSANEKIKIIFRKYDNTIITPNYLPTNMITEGTTVPTAYTPPGYKLPLKVESGAQSQDISIYIGDSKLGEEEYVDFGEQKVYKRTENLWDWKNKTINQGTSFISKRYTLKPNTTYTMSSEAPLYNYGALIMFGLPGESSTTSTNGVYQGHPITRTTDADGIVIVGLRTNNSSYDLTQFKTCLTESSTPPDTYIPYLQPTDPPVPLQPIPSYAGANRLYSTITLGEVTVQGRIKNNLPEWYKDGWQELLGPDSWYERWQVIVAAATKPSSGTIPNCSIVYGSFQDYYEFNTKPININDKIDAIDFTRANDGKRRKFVTYDSNTRTWGTVTSEDNTGYFALGNIVQNIPVKAFIIFTTPNYPGGYKTTLPYQDDL